MASGNIKWKFGVIETNLAPLPKSIQKYSDGGLWGI